jgi:hypothetical protein
MVLPAASASNADHAVAYRIDVDDRIVEVNDAWVAFAGANDGDALRPDRVTGRVLWEFLTDATTIHLYQVMCAQLREGGAPIRFRFRCDAPDVRRLLGMEMTCTDGSCIEFRVTPVADQTRVSAPFMGVSSASMSDRLISMCSWCKRVRRPDHAWVEIEDGLEALGLFQSASPAPAVTHGICEGCESALLNVPKELVTLGPLPDSGSG